MSHLDKRVDNFNAGPAVLPEPALLAAQEEMLNYRNSGMSVLEISHRSALYQQIQEEAEDRLRRLLDISEEFEVLFLQGGASLQFAMVPMNFIRPGQVGAYMLSGLWSEKAIQEAATIRDTRVAATSKDDGYRNILQAWQAEPTDAYLHLTSNNTIYGTQWGEFPVNQEVPLVADMSSDILSRVFAVDDFHLIYAGAQKNLGPAGVTLVLVRRDWLGGAVVDGVPKMLQYGAHVKAVSKYNTPPVFAVYLLGKVLQWLEGEGGVAEVERRNRKKSALLYRVIDESNGFYRGYAGKTARSRMNVTFNLATPQMEETFLQSAKEAGFVGLSGHRSVGGCRASIYNAQPLAACKRLADFMVDFQHRGEYREG